MYICTWLLRLLLPMICPHFCRKLRLLRLESRALATFLKAKGWKSGRRQSFATIEFLERLDTEFSGQVIHGHWKMIPQEKWRAVVDLSLAPAKYTRWNGFWRMKVWKDEHSHGNNLDLRWGWMYLKLQIGAQWAQWIITNVWLASGAGSHLKVPPNRVQYAKVMLERHPEPEDWDRVCSSDEVHFGWGAQHQLRIIRKPGERYGIDCI